MSDARGFGQNGQKLYSNITMPAKLDLAFTVTPTNGLGVTSVKSNGYIRNVFMHTSTTPAANNGYTNPNPPSGYVIIQMKQNYNKYLGFSASVEGPVSGSTLTSVTANNVYVINSLGTTTLAQWQAKGLYAGFTPAVGQSFTAIATGAIGGTGNVVAPVASGIGSVEMVGDPNQFNANSSIAQNGGAWFMLQLLSPTSSSVTTPIPTAPAAGSVINMSLYLDLSSVTIDGL